MFDLVSLQSINNFCSKKIIIIVCICCCAIEWAQFISKLYNNECLTFARSLHHLVENWFVFTEYCINSISAMTALCCSYVKTWALSFIFFAKKKNVIKCSAIKKEKKDVSYTHLIPWFSLARDQYLIMVGLCCAEWWLDHEMSATD